MLGKLFMYAANRAAGGAVDDLSRRAMWGALAAFSLAVGTIFGLLVLFWALEPKFGAINSGAMIAIGCVLTGLVCLSVPSIVDWWSRAMKVPAAANGPVSETVAAVDEEAAAAVDYFGPVQVIGSSFLLGLSMARQLRK